MSLDMALICPICKSVAQEFDRTGDATGFNCEMDGKFKVANTVFAEGRVRNYTNEQWEAALRKAKQRTKAGEWPVVKSSDF
jgi:thiol-disulfide isomerase/thioredoxin